MSRLVREWQQHLKGEEAATTEFEFERIRRVCAKRSAAFTIIKIVFMIDIHVHAYDYLLSH